MSSTSSSSLAASDAAELSFLRIRVNDLQIENEALRAALHLSRTPSHHLPVVVANVMTASNIVTISSSATTGTDTTECSTCGRSIQTSTLSMHSIHCARNNKLCKFCHTVIGVRDESTHVAAARGTPSDLLSALVRGDVPVLQRIFNHGVSPSAELTLAGGGDTPLHIAARAWRLPLLEVLIGVGADVNIKNNAGETPLHIACGIRGGEVEGGTSVVTALIRAGADTTARTLLGDSASQIAMRARNTDLVLIITTNGSGGGGVSSNVNGINTTSSNIASGIAARPSAITLANLRLPTTRTLPPSRPSSATTSIQSSIDGIHHGSVGSSVFVH